MLINKLLILTFVLSISTGLLKTGNALFRAMRPLLFLANIEALFDYDAQAARHTKKPVFDRDGRASRNLCSGAVLVGIRRVLITFRLQRRLINVLLLIKS
jgi:hypothetical protein